MNLHLTDSDIERMFRLGAEAAAVAHLRVCDDCQRRVDEAGRVPVTSGSGGGWRACFRNALLHDN